MKYLVVYKDENNEMQCELMNSKMVCNMYEYSDLNNISIESVKAFENGRFFNCCVFSGRCLDYEQGSHNVYICKGKPRYDKCDYLVNVIDSVYYSFDH